MNKLREGIKSKGIEVAKPFLEWGSCFDKIIQVSIKLNVNVIIIGAGEKSKNDGLLREKYKNNVPVLYSTPIVNMDLEQSETLIEETKKGLI